jgi:hypothetical protein
MVEVLHAYRYDNITNYDIIICSYCISVLIIVIQIVITIINL